MINRIIHIYDYTGKERGRDGTKYYTYTWDEWMLYQSRKSDITIFNNSNISIWSILGHSGETHVLWKTYLTI